MRKLEPADLHGGLAHDDAIAGSSFQEVLAGTALIIQTQISNLIQFQIPIK